MESTQTQTDLSVLTFRAVVTHLCSNQSTEHLNSQMPNPSIEAILLKTRSTKQTTGRSSLSF
jgi:hypothetical protein